MVNDTYGHQIGDEVLKLNSMSIANAKTHWINGKLSLFQNDFF